MPQSRALIVVTLIVIVVFAAVGLFAGVTAPRAVVSIPVSFTIGADSKTVAFEQPALNDKVQVQVTVQNGAALWRARILSGDQIFWEHVAALGEQQSYSSDWIPLSTRSYNFTFGTIGIGALDATVTVTSKGGFW
jgi:uncharacterized membrane protein